MTPLLLVIVAITFPLLMNQKPPKIDGEVAIVDLTGEVVEGVREYLLPEAIAERRGLLKKKIEEQAPAQLRRPWGAELIRLVKPRVVAHRGRIKLRKRHRAVRTDR